MFGNKTLSLAAATLLMFAGAASAEMRTFEFTGTVTYTQDSAFAPAGSKITGTFSYDDGTVPEFTLDFMSYYSPRTHLSATVAGHRIDSDWLGVYVFNDNGDHDAIAISGVPVMVGDEVLPEGVLAIHLQSEVYGTHVLADTSLPKFYDMHDFSPTLSYGTLQRHGADGGTMLQFSIDSIDTCHKRNGTIAKKNCNFN